MKEEIKNKLKKILYCFIILLMIAFIFFFGYFAGKTAPNDKTYQPTLLNVQESLKPDKKEAFNPEENTIFIDTYYNQTYLAIANTTSFIIFKNNVSFVLDSNELTITIESFVSNRLSNNSATISFSRFIPDTTINITREELNIPYSMLLGFELTPYLQVNGYECILDYELLVTCIPFGIFQDYYTYFTCLELDLTDFLSGALRIYELDTTPLILEGFNSFYEYGYYVRLNSTEDTESRLDNVWNIFERAIESVLNVLKIELLPNIPLYVVIVVPVLFALLVWFIKLSQS